MQKDHLIQLHAFLIQVRAYIEKVHKDEARGSFDVYDALNIRPHEVHKSKNKQQTAIFELMRGISDVLSETDPESHFPNMVKTLDKFCDQVEGKEEK